MRRRESDMNKLRRLEDELARGWISHVDYFRQVRDIIDRLKSKAAQTKLLRKIDAKYGKGRHPFVQGGLPELGKKR